MACVEQKPWCPQVEGYFIFTQRNVNVNLVVFRLSAQGLFVCLFPFVCVQIFNTSWFVSLCQDTHIHLLFLQPCFLTVLSDWTVTIALVFWWSCFAIINNTWYWVINHMNNIRLLYNIQVILFKLVNKTQPPRPEALCVVWSCFFNIVILDFLLPAGLMISFLSFPRSSLLLVNLIDTAREPLVLSQREESGLKSGGCRGMVWESSGSAERGCEWRLNPD